MSATGSCLCGKIKLEVTDKPLAAALCHCNDCKKISGGAFGFNWVVPIDKVKVAGAPKTFSTTANSGNPVVSHFCGDCGVTLWRDGPATKGLMYLKAGILDPEYHDAQRPVAEIFTVKRLL